jgi:hypothetical protein
VAKTAQVSEVASAATFIGARNDALPCAVVSADFRPSRRNSLQGRRIAIVKNDRTPDVSERRLGTLLQ